MRAPDKPRVQLFRGDRTTNRVMEKGTSAGAMVATFSQWSCVGGHFIPLIQAGRHRTKKQHPISAGFSHCFGLSWIFYRWKGGLDSPPFQRSTGEILKFEANLAKVLLGFVILEGSDDFLQRKSAVDNGLQTIGRYRPNHVLLICSAANGDPADTNLI